MWREHVRESPAVREMAPSSHLPISREMPDHANCRIMWFADWPWNDTRSSQTPHSLIWSMTPIVRFAESCHLPHPPICRSTVKCQSTEKRQIPWNVASFDLAFQSMERYRGWSVSKDGAFQRMERSMERYRGWSVSKDRAFLGWLAITVDLQFRRCDIKNNSRH